MDDVSKSRINIEIAYQKGYRVTDCGKLLNPKGKEIKILLCGNRKYPIFTVQIDGRKEQIRAHRFAAFCFFGAEMFQKGILVRHLNDNVTDISKDNILLGTQVDNMNDIPPEVRSEKARRVALKHGTKPPRQCKLSDEQVSQIKEMLSNGLSLRAVATIFNVHHSTIYAIKDGRTFKHVG